MSLDPRILHSGHAKSLHLLLCPKHTCEVEKAYIWCTIHRVQGWAYIPSSLDIFSNHQAAGLDVRLNAFWLVIASQIIKPASLSVASMGGPFDLSAWRPGWRSSLL